MTGQQTALDFSPKFLNPFTPDTHNHRLFEAFTENGHITTKEIHMMGCETARLRCDIRKYLRKNGMDYRVSYIEEGNRLYELRRGA
jgi:hypothetical protein